MTQPENDRDAGYDPVVVGNSTTTPSDYLYGGSVNTLEPREETDE